MNRSRSSRSWYAAPWLVASLAALSAGATELKPGEVVEVRLDAEGQATLTFEAPTAGLLSILARRAGADLAITLTNEDGEELAYADDDPEGRPGDEQLTYPVGHAGVYRLEIAAYGEVPGPVGVLTGWTATPFLAVPEDPDARPSTARPLATGVAVGDTLNPAAGDRRDVYRVTAEAGGLLVARTTNGQGDVSIELLDPDAPDDVLAYSDRDLDGNPATELATTTVTAGQTVLIRVAAVMDTPSAYVLQADVIDLPPVADAGPADAPADAPPPAPTPTRPGSAPAAPR